MSYYVDTARLRAIIEKQKLGKMKKLAEVTGVNRTKLKAILNGEVMPSVKVMYTLVKALDIPQEEAGAIFFSSNLHDA